MTRGRLYLVPNTLDFGMDGQEVDLRDVLPDAVLARAAAITHWAAENAKTTRAFLKRVGAIHPLAVPLQEQRIEELPRPPKGAARRRTPRRRQLRTRRGWRCSSRRSTDTTWD